MSTPEIKPLEVVLVNSAPGAVGSKDLVIDKHAQTDFHKVLFQAHIDVDSGAIDRVALVTDAVMYGWALITSRPIEFKVGEGVVVDAATLSQARGRFRNAQSVEVERIMSAWKAKIVTNPVQADATHGAPAARP